MDQSRLLRDELVYELKVRGCADVRGETVPSMRKQLAEILRTDSFGVPPEAEGLDLVTVDEIEIVTGKVEALETYVSHLEGIDKNVSRYLDSKLKHLYGRIRRLRIEDVPDNGNLLRAVENVTGRLAAIEVRVDDLAEAVKPGVVETVPPPPATAEETLDVSRTVINVHKNQWSPRQWQLHFTGDSVGPSVAAFLEEVEEKRLASNASKGELLYSVVDLLRGPALIWYRAMKSYIRTWNEFEQQLRAEYQPFHEQDLWTEIRQRTQGVEESVGNYFACMINLFRRLPTDPSEVEYSSTQHTPILHP